MIQTEPSRTLFPWPSALTLKPYQVHKVIAVAIAALTFFGLQMACSLLVTGVIALAGCVITILSETQLRTTEDQKSDWFSYDKIRVKQLVVEIGWRLLLIPAIGILSASLGVIPAQTVAKHILAKNLRVIFLATVAAPIGEEILFRGFLQERLEDLVSLTERYISPLTAQVKKNLHELSQLITSLFFGSIHIIGNQVAKGMKFSIFFATSCMGLFFSDAKQKDHSLLSPIGIHLAQNSGVTIGLLAGNALLNRRIG